MSHQGQGPHLWCIYSVYVTCPLVSYTAAMLHIRSTVVVQQRCVHVTLVLLNSNPNVQD